MCRRKKIGLKFWIEIEIMCIDRDKLTNLSLSLFNIEFTYCLHLLLGLVVQLSLLLLQTETWIGIYTRFEFNNISLNV